MPSVSRAQRQAAAITLDVDAAYIAGFLDGEGYISIARANRYAGRIAYRLVVGFTNRDLAVLEWIQGFLGGTINAKSRSDPLKHALAFELKSTCHPKNKELLLRVQPFIKIKRRQVEVALAFLRLGRIQKSMVARGKAWPIFRADPVDVAKREACKGELSTLNQRGPRASSF